MNSGLNLSQDGEVRKPEKRGRICANLSKNALKKNLLAGAPMTVGYGQQGDQRMVTGELRSEASQTELPAGCKLTVWHGFLLTAPFQKAKATTASVFVTVATRVSA